MNILLNNIEKTLEQDPTNETRNELLEMLDGMTTAMDGVSHYDSRPGIQRIDEMIETCKAWLNGYEAQSLIDAEEKNTERQYLAYINERNFYKSQTYREGV